MDFFHNHFNPETFWFLGRPVDARYDIAPMDQWHSVIPWVNECRLSAAVSRSIFSWTQDPALFATLWRFGTRSIFTSRMCQQQSLLANLAMFFLSSKIVGFHDLGIENRSQHFSPLLSFKSCATSLHELWTPLLGRSCRGNRH